MKKFHLFLLSVASGLILSASWPAGGFPALLFIAFLPLLFIEEYISRNRERFHGFSVLFYSYLAFFIWNLLTTWWIYNSTFFGVSMAVIFNSLFMAVAFHLFHYSKSRLARKGYGYILFVFYWISFEYLHLDWDLSWSWLNLGNAFANYPEWIQWYEYTGAFGGTLWVLVINLLLFYTLRIPLKSISRKSGLSAAIAAVVLIMAPIIFSLVKYNSYREKGDPVGIVVVQPNIDPYLEQYELPVETVLNRMTTLSDQVIEDGTSMVVYPESALQESIWENDPESSGSIQMLREYLDKHPGLCLVTGASTFKRYGEGEALSETVRWHKHAGFWYDAFNTAIFLEPGKDAQFYHKSKLVPGVERMPFPKYLKFLENFALDLGGTVGSIGRDPVRKVFRPDNMPPVAAAICYESAYGSFFSRFVRNGAEIMLIITNDGWWGNTPGHKQHLAFARMRAIETRRCIARSANTGISCFVSQRGDISQPLPYWTDGAIKARLNANDHLTFYVKYGDYIGRIITFISILMLLISIVTGFVRKRRDLPSIH